MTWPFVDLQPTSELVYLLDLDVQSGVYQLLSECFPVAATHYSGYKQAADYIYNNNLEKALLSVYTSGYTLSDYQSFYPELFL